MDYAEILDMLKESNNAGYHLSKFAFYGKPNSVEMSGLKIHYGILRKNLENVQDGIFTSGLDKTSFQELLILCRLIDETDDKSESKRFLYRSFATLYENLIFTLESCLI